MKETLIHIKERRGEWKGASLASIHPSIATAHRPRTFLKAGRATPTVHNPFAQPLRTYLPSQLVRHSLLPAAHGRGFFRGIGGPGCFVEGVRTPGPTSRRIHSNTVCIWISLIAHSGVSWPSLPAANF